jgi:hypothetical protein
MLSVKTWQVRNGLRPCLPVVNACRLGVHRGTSRRRRAAPIRVVFPPYRLIGGLC